MRKVWLWFLVVGSIVLSACSILPQEERSLSWEIVQNEGLSGDISQTGNETELLPAEALSWKEAKLTLAEVQAQIGDTTPIVVITEANSGAIVTQTGDSLIYRNEVYGFQVKLGKEWKGGQIGGVRWWKDDISLVYFTLPYAYTGEFDGSINATVPAWMSPYSITVMLATLYPIANYNKVGFWECYWVECEGEEVRKEIERDTVGHNNRFYFVTYKGSDLWAQDIHYETHYSKRKYIFSGLKFFDVKD